MPERILITVGILILIGCTQPKYINPGNAQADFGANKVECDTQAVMSSPMVPLSRGPMGRPGVKQGIENQAVQTEMRRKVEACLQSKGWTREIEESK